MKRLGHRNIRTTIDVYGHLTKNADIDLADALSEMYEREHADNVVPLRKAAL
jgi:integrase